MLANNFIVDNGDYYLYRHVRSDTNLPFYIGIGTKVKRENNNGTYQRANAKTDRNNIWRNIVRKTDYIVEILLESDNLEFIEQKEIEFISLYGRKLNGTGTLSNICDGGKTKRRIKKSTDQVIKDFESVHGDRYDYSKFQYFDAKTKSVIICKIHGEFLQDPGTHLKGCGCRSCSFKSTKRRVSKRNNSGPKFIEFIKDLYGERFDYSFIEYKGVKNKVKLICQKHGEFWQYPPELKGGHSCQECGKEILNQKRKRKVPLELPQ